MQESHDFTLFALDFLQGYAIIKPRGEIWQL